MSPEEKKKMIEKPKNHQNRRANNANASSSGDSSPKSEENADSNKSQSSVSASVQQAQRLLSQAAQHPRSIVVDGITYKQYATNISYCLNQHQATNYLCCSLIDRGPMEASAVMM